MRILAICLFSLLIQNPTESPLFNVVQKRDHSVFICRSMVKSIYGESMHQPFSFPIPSLKIQKVGIGSRKVEITFWCGASIVVYPTFQDETNSEDIVDYIFYSASIQNTRYKIKNGQLKTNKMNIEISSNIGRMVIICHPEQREEMLLPLLATSWDSVSNIANHISIDEKKKEHQMILSFIDSQECHTGDVFFLPTNSKYLFYLSDGNICVAYSKNQYVLITQDEKNASRAIYGDDSPVNIDLDSHVYEIRRRQDGKHWVSFIAPKERMPLLVKSVSFLTSMNVTE